MTDLLRDRYFAPPERAAHPHIVAPSAIPDAVELMPAIPVEVADALARPERPQTADPVARPAARHGLLRIVTRTLTILGMLSLLLTVFEWHVADISERRAQRTLRGSFADLLASGSGLGVDAKGVAGPIPEGTPVALLELPTLGVQKIVVEGTSGEDLKRGPGHLVTSPLPGQRGSAIIAARRTTYGAPFRHLDRVRVGDPISVITPYGKFAYRASASRVVRAGRASTLGSSPSGSLLTLVTSDPAYEGGRALAIVATLDGTPSAYADPPRPRATRDGAIAFAGNSGALPLAVASGILLTLLLGIAGELYRRWRRWPTYLLTMPLMLCLLYLWLQSLVSLMPSTL